MRICHVTPHVPPDQAANALLPFHLGTWARETGDEVQYVAHPPRADGDRPLPGPVVWLPRGRRAGHLARWTKLDSVARAAAIWRAAAPALAAADVVHVHSNGLLAELGAAIARWHDRPVVLTLYGTEIWHYRRRPVDLFTRAYRRAAAVTFYSRALLDRAAEHGLTHHAASVVYPPVATGFAWTDATGRAGARAAAGWSERHVLLNVKRLHPLAGQRFLLAAMVAVLQTHPDTRLVICGEGELGADLAAYTRTLGIDHAVTFAGLVDNARLARYYAAADVFVLPSLLEACPTVALEALACGTPVVSADNPGGVELRGLFGDDVAVVPREDPGALATAIRAALDTPRRTSQATRDAIVRDMGPAAVAARYRAIYEAVATASPGGRVTARPARRSVGDRV